MTDIDEGMKSGKSVMLPLRTAYIVLLLQFPLLVYVFLVYRSQMPAIYDGLQIQSIYQLLREANLSSGVLLIVFSLIASYFVSILYILSGRVQIYDGKPDRRGLLSSVYDILISLEFVVVPFLLYAAFESLRITIIGMLVMMVVYKSSKRVLPTRFAYPIIFVVSAIAVVLFPITPIYEVVSLLLITALINGIRDDAKFHVKRLIEDYGFGMWLYIQ
jgi:hypothetical protein